jgi:predicted transcriptional regulator of viral defense system
MMTELGPLETQFFSYVQMRSAQCLRLGELQQGLGLSATQEKDLLRRLARRGWIARVRRGLYLVPPTLPAGGKWSPGHALALSTLIADRDGAYQICGPNAFCRYGWIGQVPNRTYVYNNRISGQRKIGSVAFSLIKVADERLGGTESVETPGGIRLVYSSRVRSLMDAVYDWSRFSSLPQAFGWIRAELAARKGAAAELVKISLRYGNQGTLRRIGKSLELAGVEPRLLRRIEKALRPSSSVIPWIPTRPKRGTTDRRWGVVVNDG